MGYLNIFLFQAKAIGRVLFDQVCKQLHLLEADYFGLEYLDTNGTRVSTIIYSIMDTLIICSVETK